MSVVSQINAPHLLRIGRAIYEKARQETVNPDNRGYLGGSEIAYCIRKTVARHLNVPETHPRQLGSSYRLRLGNVIEEWTVELLQKGLNGSRVIRLIHTGEDQVEIAPKHVPIKLHPDGLLQVRDGNGWQNIAWLEIKSAGTKSFERQKADGLYAGYLGQVTGEMHFGAPKLTLAHVALVEDMNKYFQRVIAYDAGAGQWFEERAKTILSYIEAEELPEGEPSALCKYCPVRGACSQYSQAPWRKSPKETESELVKPTKAISQKVMRYLRLNDKKKTIESQMTEIREAIDKFIEGKGARGLDMEGDACVKYTEPQLRRELDMKRVIQHVPAEQLADCYAERISEPSLRISKPRQKKEEKKAVESTVQLVQTEQAQIQQQPANEQEFELFV